MLVVAEVKRIGRLASDLASGPDWSNFVRKKSPLYCANSNARSVVIYFESLELAMVAGVRSGSVE